MSFRFKSRPRFDKDFNSLQPKGQEIVKKQLKKIMDHTLDFTERHSPFLKGKYAGVRHLSTGGIRIYFRICKECRRLGHDIKYQRCNGCTGEDDVIVLVGTRIKKGNTYDRLKLDSRNDVEMKNFSNK